LEKLTFNVDVSGLRSFSRKVGCIAGLGITFSKQSVEVQKVYQFRYRCCLHLDEI